jgi:hypothetical protein
MHLILSLEISKEGPLHRETGYVCPSACYDDIDSEKEVDMTSPGAGQIDNSSIYGLSTQLQPYPP